MREYALAFLAVAAISCGARAATASEENYALNPKSLQAYMAERYEVGRRMQAVNDPWLTSVIAGADQGSKTYDNHGQHATLAYLFTHQPKYVPMAADLMISRLNAKGPPAANFVRQQFTNFAFNFAILDSTGLLTPARRAQLVDGLYRWSMYAQAIGTPKYVGGFRTADQDQTVGMYFGCLLTYLATRKYNPCAADCLFSTVVDGSGGERIPIGGVRPTPGPSIRNRGPQRYMAKWSAGGIGPESFEYNYNTALLVINGVLEARILTGDDTIFPEFDAYLRQQALGFLHILNPDVINPAVPAARNRPDGYAWGDDEWGPFFGNRSQLAKLTTLGALIAGALRDDPDTGVTINSFMADFVRYYGADGYLKGGPPWPIGLYHTDKPLMLRIGRKAPDWRTRLAPAHSAEGMGFTFYHTDWTRPDRSSFFMVHAPPRYGFDHEVPYFLDFGLYRRGDWAITHDVHYGADSRAHWHAAENTLTVAGFASMWRRGLLASEVVPGRYAFVDAETHGPPFNPIGYYQPPPAFDRETRRALLYLPSEQSDTIVDLSYIDAVDPRSLAKMDRYYPDHRAIMDGSPALKAWWLQMTSQPTISGDTASYTTAKGQLVRTTVLLPADRDVTAIDKARSWAPTYKGKYAIVVSDRSKQPVTVFLNVLGVTDGGVAPVSARLLFRTDRHAYVGVRRPGEGETLLKIALSPSSRPGVLTGSLSDLLAEYNATRPSDQPASTLPGVQGTPAVVLEVAF
jgi:hypothetical protein